METVAHVDCGLEADSLGNVRFRTLPPRKASFVGLGRYTIRRISDNTDEDIGMP